MNYSTLPIPIRARVKKKAETKPHIGLWLFVEGAISDIDDDAGEDGQGGRWASVTINYRKKKEGFDAEFPRPVVMYFSGADANAVRALTTGDYIKANGRISTRAGFMSALQLLPAELVEYRRAPAAP
jgi:hypothetical protein